MTGKPRGTYGLWDGGDQSAVAIAVFSVLMIIAIVLSVAGVL